MLELTNHGSGELKISNGVESTLTREQANRLILHARMHSVEEFVKELSNLIPHQGVVESVLKLFGKARNSSERWNLKEKFARLVTSVKGYQPKDPAKVIEVIEL